MAESRSTADGIDRRSLSALRGQFTRAHSTSAEQEGHVSARYHEEERLRGEVRRERRLRHQELRERVLAQQSNLVMRYDLERERTLQQVEREMREAMETELAEEGREAIAREESRLRDEHLMRLEREMPFYVSATRWKRIAAWKRRRAH